MMKSEKWIQQGRDEMLSTIIRKFEGLHDEYTRQGDEDSADLLTDLVAWMQDDLEGISNTNVVCKSNRWR
jgi:hypothetical protein